MGLLENYNKFFKYINPIFMKIKVFGVKQNLSFIIYKLFTSKNYNLFKIITGLLFLLLIIILYPVIKIKIIESIY